MNSKVIAVLLALPLLGAEPAGYKFWSAADLKNMADKMSHNTKSKTSLEALGTFGRDRAVMVHRNVSGMAELHETDADVIMIVAGEGTLVVGGKMVAGKRTEAAEVRGSSIEGGTRQKMAPGDIMHIPPKTPHQVLLDPGAQISYFTYKVKE